MSKNFEDIKSAMIKESDAILDAVDSLDETAVNKLLKVIVECRGKLIFSGCGTSGAAGKRWRIPLVVSGGPDFF